MSQILHGGVVVLDLTSVSPRQNHIFERESTTKLRVFAPLLWIRPPYSSGRHAELAQPLKQVSIYLCLSIGRRGYSAERGHSCGDAYHLAGLCSGPYPFGRLGYSAEQLRLSGCAYHLAGVDAVLRAVIARGVAQSGETGVSEPCEHTSLSNVKNG